MWTAFPTEWGISYHREVSRRCSTDTFFIGSIMRIKGEADHCFSSFYLSNLTGGFRNTIDQQIFSNNLLKSSLDMFQVKHSDKWLHPAWKHTSDRSRLLTSCCIQTVFHVLGLSFQTPSYRFDIWSLKVLEDVSRAYKPDEGRRLQFVQDTKFMSNQQNPEHRVKNIAGPIPVKSWVGGSSSKQARVLRLVISELEGLQSSSYLCVWQHKRTFWAGNTVFQHFQKCTHLLSPSFCILRSAEYLQLCLLKEKGNLNLCFSILFQKCKVLVKLSSKKGQKIHKQRLVFLRCLLLWSVAIL